MAFLLIRLIPGDPVLLMVGERGASPERIAEMRANLGLDLPLWEQYVRFVGNALQGDLGESVFSRRPVWSEFADRFPATLELSLIALAWSVLIGIPLGVLAAIKRRRWPDHVLMSASLVGYSMPIFWWGLVLILFFSVRLGWTPVSGRMSAAFDVEPFTGFFLIDVWIRGLGWAGFKDALAHLILPALVLGTIPVAAIARMTRSSLLEVLREDYVRTAKAKGLSFFQIVFVHALSNALIPVVTVIGLMLGTLLTGAVLTETLFSWPGVGRWLVTSVQARDYPVLQGGVLLLAVIIVVVNTFVDVLYMWLNPRLRGNLQ
ncbi:MAG: ABC transporter permease subunit [Bdellovibrionales bacterium]|nr:ABC transporter permease subunit [Bdellovibrionales bacterium]